MSRRAGAVLLLLAAFAFTRFHSLKAQSLQVVATFPGPNALQADWNTLMMVSFNQPLDSNTVDASKVHVFGRWSGVHPLSIALVDSHRTLQFQSARPFFAGELVTVMLSRGFAAASGDSLSQGYAFQFWTRVNPGNLDLHHIATIPVRQPGEGPIQTYGVYAGDLDEDGDSDLAAPNEIANDVRVFLNPDTGLYNNFSIYPLPQGSRPSTNEGADFNGDGHIDLAVGNSTNNKVSLLFGDGLGQFLPEVAYTVGNGVRGLSVLDLNGDGFPDIATANRNSSNVSLLRNLGDGTFAPARHIETGADGETACVSADFNEDGVLDLAVGARYSQQIAVLLGDGEDSLLVHGLFPAGGRPWMLAAGDVNGDGHVDVLSANDSHNTGVVLFGDGQGNLSAPISYPAGTFPIAIDAGDLDGDGDLDMVISSFLQGIWTLYENDGSGSFVRPRTLTASQAASCAVLHDFDQDGDLDMTGIDELADLLFLFANDVATTVQQDPPEAVVQGIQLFPAFPNPMNPGTRIQYTLSGNLYVEINIVDIGGRVIRRLVRQHQTAGKYLIEWDGKNDAGQSVASGIYLVTLRAGQQIRTSKIILLR